MKTRKQFLSILAGGAGLGAVTSAGAKGREPADPARNRQVEMENLVLAKTFCVAMRRGDRARMRELLSPEYLAAHGFGEGGELPAEIAPVFGIHNIIVGTDGETALCLYQTKEGGKEAMLLRTRVEGDRRYICPASSPVEATGQFAPWILRQALDSFIAA